MKQNVKLKLGPTFLDSNVLIAYFLQPNWKNQLKEVAEFILFHWTVVWFETHLDPNVGQQLEVILSAKEKWNKALQSFQKNWNFTMGRINVVHTNLIA